MSVDDRILITNLYFAKGYGAVRLIHEFPAKGWKKSALNDFIKRLKQTGSTTTKSTSLFQQLHVSTIKLNQSCLQ